MSTRTDYIDELLTQIAGMSTVEESAQVHKAITAFKIEATPDDYLRVRQALSVRLNQLADQFESELGETTGLVQ